MAVPFAARKTVVLMTTGFMGCSLEWASNCHKEVFMLTPIKDTEIIKRFYKPPGDSPDTPNKNSGGTVTVFPNTPLDMPSETFKNGIERREQNRKELIHWIKHNLKPEIDYGRVHLNEWCQFARAGNPNLCRDISHYSRPMLYKSGAERIIGVMGLSANFPNLKQYEMACVHRQEITQIILKCELRTSSGKVVAEGSGARHIRQDNWNLNTSIKMAVKSALIDAVIRVASLTGVFLKTHQNTLTNVGGCHQNALPGGVDCHKKLHGTSDYNAPPTGPVTHKQRELILKLAGGKGLTTEGLEKDCQRLFNEGLDCIDKVQASKLIQHLNG